MTVRQSTRQLSFLQCSVHCALSNPALNQAKCRLWRPQFDAHYQQISPIYRYMCFCTGHDNFDKAHIDVPDSYREAKSAVFGHFNSYMENSHISFIESLQILQDPGFPAELIEPIVLHSMNTNARAAWALSRVSNDAR